LEGYKSKKKVPKQNKDTNLTKTKIKFEEYSYLCIVAIEYFIERNCM